MKKRGLKINIQILLVWVSVSILILLLYLFSLSLTANLIRNVDFTQSYNFNEDIQVTYSILVDNTGVLASQNISQINVTLPSSFVFVENTNQTSAQNSTFIREGNLLRWTGDNLISNLSSRNFSFNASAPTPGTYNLSVSVVNNTGIESQNLSVTINDTSAPHLISFVSPSDTHDSTISRTYIKYNISVQDNVAVNTITTYLYNSTRDLVFWRSSQTNPLVGNFSNLTEGTYYLNASANDSVGNLNNSIDTKKIILDTSAPIVTLSSPAYSAIIVSSPYFFTFNVDSLAEINACTLLFNNAGVSTEEDIETNGTNRISKIVTNGAYNWSVNCTDVVGNKGNSSKRPFTVALSSVNTSSSSGSTTNSPANSSNSSNIIQVNVTQIKNSYENSNITKDTEIKFTVVNQNHSLKINNITTNSINITLYSSPRYATISVGEEKKFELSGDNYTDLKIKLNSIANNQANLTIKEIHELIANGTTQQTSTSQDGEKTSSKLILILGISGGVIVLMILGVVLFLKSSKKKKEDNGNEDGSSNENLSPGLPPLSPPPTISTPNTVPAYTSNNLPIYNPPSNSQDYSPKKLY